MSLKSEDIVEKLKAKFSKEKLRDLKNLTEHEGWKVLIELWELHKIELWLSVNDVDFNDKNQVKILSDRQIYVNAFENVLKIPWNMQNLETFGEYKEGDFMPVYDPWYDEDDFDD